MGRVSWSTGVFWVLGMFGSWGCSETPEQPPGTKYHPVTALLGEAHLHQFPKGAHAWANFVEPAWPAENLHGDGLVHLDIGAAFVEGPCAVYQIPSCTPLCQPGSYCAQKDLCSPLPQVRSIDGGILEVVGSKAYPTIRMWWAGTEEGYVSEPEPGTADVFVGGEILEVRALGRHPFAGRLPAPMPVELRSPKVTSEMPLRLPQGGPLGVTWVPQGGQSMVIRIAAASTQGKGSSYIRCVLSDSGHFSVSERLLATLPEKPRTVRFELDRSESRIFDVPTAGAGLGFVVHAEYTAWHVGEE